MPYTTGVPEPSQRITVKADALRELYRARDMMNALFFMGQRRMSFSSTIHVLAELLRERWKVDQEGTDDWLSEASRRLAPKFTGKAGRESDMTLDEFDESGP